MKIGLREANQNFSKAIKAIKSGKVIVLLKRYVREKGTDRALVLMHQHLVISAAIAPLEMRSAMRRLTAESGLSAKALLQH
jgi:hypothetical protein